MCVYLHIWYTHMETDLDPVSWKLHASYVPAVFSLALIDPQLALSSSS